MNAETSGSERADLDDQPATVLKDVEPASRGFVRFLYSQNPFYLLSVCFVLHGTGIWYRANATTHSPWILFGIITGYILMMAGTGFVIVRRGQVWNDARSILLILLALFLELAMTADDVLVDRPATGRAMLLAAWLVAIGVSEFILIGLRIRLQSLYRVPFHLLLGLIVLYPLAIVRGEYPHDGERIAWVIFLFSPVSSLALLTLLPAIRRGVAYAASNGTPWSWPLYPWSLFVFLLVVVLFRSYSLCLSFDPVMEVSWDQALALQNRFGGVYFAPVLLALSVLCLEWAKTTGANALRRTGLLLPLIALWATIPPLMRPGNQLYLGFLQQLTSVASSPAWIAAWLSVVIYGIAMIRRVRSAETGLSVALVLLAFLSPESLRPDWFTAPHTLPLALAAAIQIVVGYRRGHAIKVFAGLLCCLVILRSTLPADLGLLRDFVVWTLLIASALATGIGMSGEFARKLYQLGTAMLTATCCLSPLALTESFQRMHPSVSDGAVWLVMLLYCAASCVLWWLRRDTEMSYSAGLNVGTTLSAGVVKGAAFILRLPGGRGILWGLGGLLWFALAAWISIRKARAENGDSNTNIHDPAIRLRPPQTDQS